MSNSNEGALAFFEVHQCPQELFRDVCMTRGAKLLEFVKANKDKYIHVANVRTDDVARVFTATNTINHAWWENEDVDPLFEGEGCRSTSVGDYVVFPDGTAHIVDSIGYTKL